MAAPASTTYSSAKDLLEDIGESIQQKATISAKGYRQYLHGNLKKAEYPKDRNSTGSTPSNPCDLNYQYHTNVTKGYDKENPCGNRPDVRFSDKYGGQCTDSKIKGNNTDTGGACAPLRRLFLCDQHLSHMEEDKIDSTDNLLLEVLLAAKYEGDSIIKNYPKKLKNREGICTALARSFADIGDIIRGKDLFIGYNEKDRKEKAKLQENLRKIFKEIHNNLQDTEAKKHYNDNDKDGNYFKLREDWWALNRKEVWKAITCSARDSDTYSIYTGNGLTKFWLGRCGSDVTNVPTNLDYAPQFLRWFDEWADDFCRIRKRKLQNAIEKCRGQNGKEKYCTLNGYDCTKTVRGENKLVRDYECTDCLIACDPFVQWIDNQKLELDKQKKKYENAIKEETTKETQYRKINNIYTTLFYEQLKQEYGNANKFLELLNKEKECQSQPEVKDKTYIDFLNGNDVFSHTEYCKPCPWCGVHGENGKWTPNNIDSCGDTKNIWFNYRDITNISILSSDKGNQNMLKKYKNFCENSDKKNQMEKWKCHFENSEKDDCVLQNKNKGTSEQNVMSYYVFFYRWVSEMLKDSIAWGTQHSKCLKTDKKQCMNKCKTFCKCFESWVMQKENEWARIKRHFKKQRDIKIDANIILDSFLEHQFFTDIKEAYGNDEAIKRIRDVISKNSSSRKGNTLHSEDILDKLFYHELEQVQKCLAAVKNDTCPKTQRDCNQPHDDDFDEDDDVGDKPCGSDGNKRRAMEKKVEPKKQGTLAPEEEKEKWFQGPKGGVPDVAPKSPKVEGSPIVKTTK
ncbi:hypothetical protein PFTANZ_01497, partial [Plasmodium falciparum Tanzania (2000708)]